MLVFSFSLLVVVVVVVVVVEVVAARFETLVQATKNNNKQNQGLFNSISVKMRFTG